MSFSSKCPFYRRFYTKNKNGNTEYQHLHTIQNSGLFKKSESYFPFVWVKEFGIISSCLDKVRVFSN